MTKNFSLIEYLGNNVDSIIFHGLSISIFITVGYCVYKSLQTNVDDTKELNKESDSLLSAFRIPPAHTTRSTCSDDGGIPSQSWAVKRIASRVMEEDPKIVERVMVVLEDHAELKCDVVALVSASMQAWTVGTPLD